MPSGRYAASVASSSAWACRSCRFSIFPDASWRRWGAGSNAEARSGDPGLEQAIDLARDRLGADQADELPAHGALAIDNERDRNGAAAIEPEQLFRFGIHHRARISNR